MDIRLSEEERKLEEASASSSNISLVSLDRGSEATSADKTSSRICW